jgi:hypothetical protein
MWHAHTVEHSSALERETLSFAVTQMNPEDFVLNEARQAQEDRCYMSSLTRAETRMVVTERGHRGETLVTGYKVSVKSSEFRRPFISHGD